MSWYFSYHFVSCMRFSRYILFWLFYQSSEIKISFHLWSLVNPVMLNSTALLVGLTWRYFPLINTTIFHLSLCSCLYLYKKSFRLFSYRFGSHLLSHTVSSAVPSASQVLTIVFGMGTGVSPGRIATEKFCTLWALITKQQISFNPLLLLPF